jgi:hypothetical protein
MPMMPPVFGHDSIASIPCEISFGYRMLSVSKG